MIDPFQSSLLATVNLATKPFTFVTLVVIFTVKLLFVVVQTWLELIKSSFDVHLSVVRSIIRCAAAVITFPFRVMTSIQRARLLEEELHSTLTELDTLSHYAEELEDRLDRAIRQRVLLESALAEVEDETDKIVGAVEQLAGEVQDLQAENCELKEILNSKYRGVADSEQAEYPEKDYGVSYMVQRWEARNQGSGASSLKLGDKIRSWPSRDGERSEELDSGRENALLQSLFSASLSLLIRIVIWKAEDPCTPLVLALFTVVGMSSRSVIHFFSNISNKPASDAVALLCLNCFILGTLAGPTLRSVTS